MIHLFDNYKNHPNTQENNQSMVMKRSIPLRVLRKVKRNRGNNNETIKRMPL